MDDCDVFISCLDSHSDGTHSLQRIIAWASDGMLHFSKSVPIKKQAYLHIWSEGDFSANFHFWVNYSFKWHLVLHNIIILQEMTTYYQRIIFFINFVMSVVLVGLCLFDQITLRSKGLEQEWYIPPFCLPFLCWMALVFSGKKEITLCIPLMCLQKSITLAAWALVDNDDNSSGRAVD